MLDLLSKQIKSNVLSCFTEVFYKSTDSLIYKVEISSRLDKNS